MVPDGARGPHRVPRRALCFLSYDDEHHRLALIHVPGWRRATPKAPAPTMSPMPIATLATAGDLRRLQAHGILPHWPINHGVTTSLYYRDPDNNRVELQIDNFSTVEELQGYFQSAAFAANPVGVTYDPRSCAAATRPARRWPICCAFRRCPKGRLPGTC